MFVPSREAKKLHALLRHVLVRIICVNGKIKCAYERVCVYIDQVHAMHFGLKLIFIEIVNV